jgi:hypothetical protein
VLSLFVLAEAPGRSVRELFGGFSQAIQLASVTSNDGTRAVARRGE